FNNHFDAQNAANFFDSLPNPEMENLRKQLEDLQLVLYNKDSEIQQLKESQISTLGNTNETSNGVTDKGKENSDEQRDKDVNMNMKLEQENISLKQRLKDTEIHIKQLQTQLETTAAVAAAAAVGTSSGSAAEARCRQLEEELDAIKREQEDLLVLVTDQDSKVSEYRRKLRG
ncbi:hypothetical protein OTU49_013796, partial [Cherax quadricarinatus]